MCDDALYDIILTDTLMSLKGSWLRFYLSRSFINSKLRPSNSIVLSFNKSKKQTNKHRNLVVIKQEIKKVQGLFNKHIWKPWWLSFLYMRKLGKSVCNFLLIESSSFWQRFYSGNIAREGVFMFSLQRNTSGSTYEARPCEIHKTNQPVCLVNRVSVAWSLLLCRPGLY